MSERNNNAEWHRRHQERLARLAVEMGRMFTPGHETSQSSEYEAVRAEYLWAEHMKAEHDKFDRRFIATIGFAKSWQMILGSSFAKKANVAQYKRTPQAQGFFYLHKSLTIY